MLAKAQCQSPNLSTEPPSSGASPLPHLFCVVWKIKPAHLPAYALFKPCTKPLWEQACSRKRSVSHRIYRLNHRLRGQAPSHICFCVVWKIRPAHLPAYALFKPCTKPLWERACSRKRSVSHRIYRLNHRLRGQGPSHICFMLLGRSSRHTCLLTHCSNLAQNSCGSGLAREGAVSVTEFID